ncbi:MAG TPA: hypothetical protein VJ867_14880 [Gemmatimonadaceae bacterium]|nr:hypothetical protein [Gemmatimonadaceae bacterium]
MRRYVPLLIAGAALIAAACGEMTSPSGTSTSTRAMAVVPSGPNVSSARANRTTEDNGTTTRLVLWPGGGFALIGPFILTYPANAVCDPNRSGYGPDEWKNPCSTLRTPMVLQAKFWTDNGVAYAEFTPDIRFDPSKTVSLTTFIRDIRGQQLTDALKAQYSVGYTLRTGDTRFFVDESYDDASVQTVFGVRPDGSASGWARRRIYHFSGYYVRSGRVCDDSDPTCSGGTGLY